MWESISNILNGNKSCHFEIKKASCVMNSEKTSEERKGTELKFRFLSLDRILHAIKNSRKPTH